MKIRAEEIASVIRREIETYRTSLDVADTGTVLEVGDGIARIHGLTNAMAGEMLEFENGISAQVMNLEEDSIGAVVLGDYLSIREGMKVRSTGKLLSVPVGDAVIGRVVDPLGNPLDGLGPVQSDAMRPLEVIAPGISDRQPVKQPLMTGIKAIAETLVVRNDGTVWDTFADARVEPLTGIAAVSTSGTSRCALADDGTVWTLDPSVSHVDGLTNVTEVVAHGSGVCRALRSDGRVWEARGSSMTQVAGITDAISISGGGGHVVFARMDGTVWGWGANTAGELGNGDSGPTAIVPSSSPVQVVF